MTESRLRLEVRDDLETVEQHDVELLMGVDMAVTSRLNALAWTGVAGIVIGALITAIGAFLFVRGYPDAWHALDRSLAASRDHVELVVTLMILGATLMLLGSTFFFFGRRTTGEGRSGTMRLEAS